MSVPIDKRAKREVRRQVLLVNGRFLQSFLACGAAYLMWPSSLAWWGFYPISSIIALGGLISLIQAFKLIAKIRNFEEERAELERMGKPMKEASLTESAFLTSEGVIHHGK